MKSKIKDAKSGFKNSDYNYKLRENIDAVLFPNLTKQKAIPEGKIGFHAEGISFIQETVNHPTHYGGKDNPYEVIKVLEHCLSREEFIGFLKGNIVKYTLRAGKKVGVPKEQCHGKSKFYDDYLNSFLEQNP